MLEFLEDEKMRMTKLQYQQEYLGLFVGGIMRLFDDELIDKICILQEDVSLSLQSLGVHKRFLGVDVARMGGDETVLLSLLRNDRGMLKMFNLEIAENTLLTDTVRLILHKDLQYKYKKIYIDDGGMGVGVFDPLLEHNQTKRKIIAINNARRSIDKEHGVDANRKVPLMNLLCAVAQEF